MGVLNRHEATLFVEVASTDADGNVVRVASPTGARLVCQIQPVSSEELSQLGQVTATVYRLMARSIPAGAWAQVEWQGRRWDVVGEPKRVTDSPATTHDTLLIRARTAEAL